MLPQIERTSIQSAPTQRCCVTRMVITRYSSSCRSSHSRSALSAIVGLILANLCPVRADADHGWESQFAMRLCQKYVEACPQDESEMEREELLERIATSLGGVLASSGTSAVPSEDIAVLALLLSRQDKEGHSRFGDRSMTSPIPQAAESLAPQVEIGPLAPDDAVQGADPQLVPAVLGVVEDSGFSDIGKGQEGFLQGVERLARLPVSERMVITGDITSGVQAATVNDAPNLTSAFGRVRVNFVARAVPASAGGRLSEGYFTLQMRAAGGPFDTSPVGGPSSFSSLNDVATHRSRFNEGTSRGNLYLAKAFYQQELRLGDDYIVGRVGIVNLSDFFDTNEFANNEARQFLNSAFVNSAAYKSGISAPGLMGEYHRSVGRDWLQGLVFRAGYAISRTERAFTSPIWTGETELQVRVRGNPGKLRFGGTLGNVAGAGGIRGYHLGFDQWISGDLGVFGRFAQYNTGPGSLSLGPVKHSYSGGVQRRFVDQRDRVSQWGIGFSQSFGIETEVPLASEKTLETYFRWQVSEIFSLTPDFQFVFGSGGSRIQGLHVVTGLRMNFGF